MRDIKTLLTPSDQDFLNTNTSNSWVPKEPKSVLLPYQTTEKTDEENNGLDERRKEAREVYNGYTDLIQECKQLEAVIEEKCKSVTVSLDRSSSKRVMEAMGRVFGQGLQENIIFDQYKACIKALAELNNDIPKPGDKQ